MAKGIEQFLARRAAMAAEALEQGDTDDAVNKILDREHDVQFHLPTHNEDVILIALNRLRPYAKHPFKNYQDEKLDALAESIARDGLQQPIIIRAVDGIQGYEILAGHNRAAAMAKLGKRDIPAIIRILDDDKAALVVVNTNLEQREKLLPSEKAFAYKLQMEALQNSKNAIIQNGVQPSDANGLKTGAQFERHTKSREIVASSNGIDRNEIQRYIRLTQLLPELLTLLDQDRYPVMAGYEISFLDTEAQQAVCQYFFQDSTQDKLSLKNAETIRTAYQEQKSITVESIPLILHKPKKKPGPKTYHIPHKAIRQFILPDDFNFEDFVLKALEQAYPKR